MKPREPYHSFRSIDRPCLAPGCTKDRGSAKEYCSTHYMRLKRTGSLDRTYPVDQIFLTPLGVNITALRIARGLKVGAFAKKVGFSAQTLWRVCSGHSFSIDTLYSIAAFFNVEAWELLKPDYFPLPPEARDIRRLK